MLSSHRFLCLPLRLPPWTVPCRIVLASPDDCVTCLYHFSLSFHWSQEVFIRPDGVSNVGSQQPTNNQLYTKADNSKTNSGLFEIRGSGFSPLICLSSRDDTSEVQRELLLFVGCSMPQQHASVFQGRTCSDNFTYCHNEIEVADQTLCLTQSQYTDNGPTSLSADLIKPGAWQGSHWSANFEFTGLTQPGRIPWLKQDLKPRFSTLKVDALTTRPTGQSERKHSCA